jgi:hypothetical protein
MTSDLKIVTNRKNAKNSTGPRTNDGKSRASHNALRHGLAAVNFPDDGHTEKVERMARAICKDDTDSLKYMEALIIVESQVLLARVRAARVTALEGVEKERENERGSRSDGEIENWTVAPRLEIKTAKQAGKPVVPRSMRPREAPMRADGLRVAGARRPSHEGLRRVLPELISLERYERRALSRRRRALRRLETLRSKDAPSVG